MVTIEVVKGVRYPFTNEYKAAIWAFKKELEKARKLAKGEK